MVIVALQASKPIHLGVDIANVVGYVGRIISGLKFAKPLELLVDGDLLELVRLLKDLICLSSLCASTWTSQRSSGTPSPNDFVRPKHR